jgi:hypothetical protein
MNSRERVKRAVDFQQPDHVPISHAVLPATQLKYGKALEEVLATVHEDFGWEYMRDLGVDEYPTLYMTGHNADDFGTIWRGERLGLCSIPVDWPIKDLDRYDEYLWPEVFSAGPPKGRLYSGHMAGIDDRWYARGAWFTYFEQLQQLRGMENLFVDIAAESPEFYRLLDDLLEFNLRWIDKWNQLEYDGLEFADDWGGQLGMMVSPQAWRRIFKPRYAEMFKRVRDAGKHVWYHIDGRVNQILPEFVEIGARVVNCQVYVVGHEWIRANLRGKVAIRTDIDCQHVLPFGSPSQIKEEVNRTFDACGTQDGGLIACGEVGPDVPLENIRALYEAFAEFGTCARCGCDDGF